MAGYGIVMATFTLPISASPIASAFMTVLNSMIDSGIVMLLLRLLFWLWI